MIERIKQLLFGSHTDFFELSNSILLIIWGGWLLLPFDTFHNVKALSVLQRIIPESLFAFIPLSIGSYILYTLLTLKFRKRSKALLLGTAFWVFLTIIIGAVSATSAGLPVHSVIAIFTALTYLRK